MRKNYLLCVRIETEDLESFKKQADNLGMSVSEFCRQKLRECSQLNRIELIVEEIQKKLNTKLNSIGGIEMVTKLPEFKGYTVDERLKQFRKVDHDKPSIEFVEFNSEKGKKLLDEYEDQEE